MVLIHATVTDEPVARVAGAEVPALHTLPASKFHKADDGGECHLKLDALGAADAGDVSLTACPADNTLIVKVGSAARTHITLPEGADPAAIYGELESGALDIHVPTKK